jgi:hypothetical protein
MTSHVSGRAAGAAQGQLTPVTFVPPDGCRVYDIVDAQCFQECIDERGLPAKNFCRSACKYTVIECDTFPSSTL